MDNKVGVNPIIAHAKLEETEHQFEMQIAPHTTSEQRRIADEQIADDDRLIPNIGDERWIESDGKFGSPDGETFIPTKLRFLRIRNKNMGVDVQCHVPALGFANGVN